MTTYDFVHLVLLAFGGSIQGRTKLQKTVYFIGALTDSLDELGYRPYFYGPYSSEVAAAIQELRSLGFLRQTTASAGAVDPKGFEVTRYDYTLTDEGRQIAEEKAAWFQSEWKQIQTASAILETFPNIDYVKLSIAAKMLYLVNKEGKATVSELVQLTPRFGWDVSVDQMTEAGRFLERLNLLRFE